MSHFVRPLSILTALALAGTAFPALAAQVHLTAALTGGEEVPANDSAGTGMVDAMYDSESNVFTYTVTYDGLTGPAVAAHFHGPANPGETAPPSLPIEGDLTSPIAGTATLTDAQEAELLSGMWYFNVHTAQYPDGELRGQMLQTMMSSEASSMSSESGGISSEEPSSEMSSESSSLDPSSTLSSVSSDLSSTVSSVSSDLSSTLSSVSSDVSSTLSSVSSDLSSTLSSLDPSVSVSASASISASVSP